MELPNCYEDARRADAYAKLEFPGTYYLAYRDLPEIIGNHVRGSRAIDFGCGTGRSTRFLRQHGFDAVGVDIAQDMIRKAREVANIKVMIPFCRTVEEGRRVLAAMAAHGLRQGQDGLEVYAMCEVPSNAVMAEEFLRIFDGFSIGSNDLTQLTLGIDRDSGTVAHLFDERDAAVRWLIARAIAAARRLGKPIGICGQAPSDYPEFAEWLVSEGIDSISLNPDVAIATAIRVAQVEAGARSGAVR